MSRLRLLRPLVAALVLVSMLCQGTWTLAGTTGTLSGYLYLTGGTTPVGDATITVTSPSQTGSTLTDATGHFVFLSLAPDTYTVSGQKAGYEPISQTGITVVADQTRTLALSTRKALTIIGRVTSRSSNDLVRPGTTADVYSVSAEMATAAGALGGGGNLNNAYSGIASVPGTYVPQGQAGYGQDIFIRGGDYDQVGYEYDGIPVNRSFDNYVGGTLSNLGQQELQVYTGGAPAGASASSISGFINQVLRTGTYPGFGTATIAAGYPSFYHKLNFELGGASPNRNFSYYIGVGGFTQTYRLVDQANGNGANPAAGYATVLNYPWNNSLNGVVTGVVPGCVAGATPPAYLAALPPGVSDPGCYAFGGVQIGYGTNVQASAGGIPFSDIADREGVVNLHFGLPHRRDSGKDDIQVMFSTSSMFSHAYSSQNDVGLNALFNAVGPPANHPECVLGGVLVCTSTLSYLDPPLFPNGTKFGTPATGLVAVPYFQPGSSLQRQPNALLDPNHRDGYTNDQSIAKVQYQKNFGSNAYARLYGYTFYSDWLINGPNYNALFLPTVFNAASGNQGPLYGQSPDYELSTHTRGLELQLADQITPQHLLNLTLNYTTASTVRANNTALTQLAGTGSRATNDTDYLTTGIPNCYTATGALGPCNRPQPGFPVTAGTFTNPTPFAPVMGTWIVTNPGQKATFNTVVPKFSSVALSDQWKPTDKLLLNLGLRFERFEFDLANTNDLGKNFWFLAGQREFCYDPLTLLPDVRLGRAFATAPGAPCPAAPATAPNAGNPQVHPDAMHRTLTNKYDPVQASTVVSPRIAATYTMDPDTVLRFSYGKYSQPVNAAFTQYNLLQPNLARFLFETFWKYGFTSPRHDVVPSISDNYDLSLEHRVHNSDLSFKLTPFYRSTKDQVQQFFLDPTTGFVSGLNVGHQTSYGFEVQVNKGDFRKNGFSGQLSYTYTNTKIKYGDFRSAPGHNVIDILNQQIQQYNRFTSACAITTPGAATNPLCGFVAGGPPLTAAQLTAAPCFAAGTNTPAPCVGANILNPYFNDPAQPLFDRNGSYLPFDIFPAIAQGNGLPGGVSNSYYVPHVFTAILNWRHDKLAITPSFMYSAGNVYGIPGDIPGIDPTTCASNSAASGIATAPNPLQADYTSCAGFISVPNPENSGRFTQLGQYHNPAQFSVNAQISYDVSPKMTARLTLANLFNRCFGGSSTPWRAAFSANTICAFGSQGTSQSPIAPHGGFFNGSGPNDLVANGVPLNPYLAHTYQPIGFVQPFQAVMEFQFKL